MLAPLGAFGSAGPVARGKRRVRSEFVVLQTPKASSAPRPARRPASKNQSGSPCADPCASDVRFLAHFLQIENSSKIRRLKKHPKISKCDPRSAEMSILRSFLGPFLASIFDHFFTFFQNGVISRNHIKTNGISMILPPHAFHFGIKVQSKIHAIFDIVF